MPVIPLGEVSTEMGAATFFPGQRRARDEIADNQQVASLDRLPFPGSFQRRLPVLYLLSEAQQSLPVTHHSSMLPCRLTKLLRQIDDRD